MDQVKGFTFYHPRTRTSRAKGEVLRFAFPKDTLGFREPSLLKRASRGVGGPAGPGGSVSAWRKEGTFKCICNISSQPCFPEP